MHEKINYNIKFLSHQKELDKIKSQNIHALNKRLKNKKNEIIVFSKCNSLFKFYIFR